MVPWMRCMILPTNPAGLQNAQPRVFRAPVQRPSSPSQCASVAQNGNGAMKKLLVALLVIGTAAVAVVYIWVDSYTKKVDQRGKDSGGATAGSVRPRSSQTNRRTARGISRRGVEG